MNFDKSRVYTAVNADELKVGSKVLVADNLETLKKKVDTDEGVQILKKVWGEDYEERFEVEGLSFCYRYPLAYLVTEKEKLKWTDLKLGDMVKHKDNGIEFVVTGIDRKSTSTGCHHVFFANMWVSDSILANYEKVEEQNDNSIFRNYRSNRSFTAY